jgi:hypothetical protein
MCRAVAWRSNGTPDRNPRIAFVPSGLNRELGISVQAVESTHQSSELADSFVVSLPFAMRHMPWVQQMPELMGQGETLALWTGVLVDDDRPGIAFGCRQKCAFESQRKSRVNSQCKSTPGISEARLLPRFRPGCGLPI